MKRKWGVGAIVLPCPTNEHPPIQPLTWGDRIPIQTLKEIMHAAPATLPLSLLSGRRLTLHLKVINQGSLLACIPMLLVPERLRCGRIHLPILSEHPATVGWTYLSTHSLQAPLYGLTALTGYSGIATLSQVPHLIFMDGTGRVQSVVKGFYLHSSNVRLIHEQRCFPPPLPETPIYLQPRRFRKAAPLLIG